MSSAQRTGQGDGRCLEQPGAASRRLEGNHLDRGKRLVQRLSCWRTAMSRARSTKVAPSAPCRVRGGKKVTPAIALLSFERPPGLLRSGVQSPGKTYA